MCAIPKLFKAAFDGGQKAYTEKISETANPYPRNAWIMRYIWVCGWQRGRVVAIQTWLRNVKN